MTTSLVHPPQPAWRAPTPPHGRNYPYNCWWVAGLSSEIGRELLGRWLLDTPVLLYRGEDGQVVAMENRCPHRSAPLSLGKLKGDNVECGYHGFTFGSDGRCVRVPSMGSAVPAIAVRTFPVVEQPPFVWIYVGDPERLAETPSPFQLDWVDDPAFGKADGRLDVAGNYMLIKENVLDLTHFGYVHATSFKILDWINPPRFGTDGDTTSFYQTFKRSPLPAYFAEPLGLTPGAPYDRENNGSFVSPALQIAMHDVKDPDTGATLGRFRVAHATTPVDASHAYYFWVVGRDYGVTPDEIAALKTSIEVGFHEDERMIEAVQEMVSRDPRGAHAPEISVRMDRAGVEARRIVQQWMARESRPT